MSKKINICYLNVILFLCTVHLQRADNIPDYLYRLPLIGDGTVRKERSSLLEPLHENVGAAAGNGGMCEGACISSRACTYYNGQSSGSCINGNVCCKFERTCDGTSREKISFFHSPDYPSFLNETLECRHFIYPNEDHCALRVDFMELKAAKGVRYSGGILKCIRDNVYILNTLGGPNDSICEFEYYSAIFYVNPKSPKPVTILFVMQSDRFKWRIRVTQLNCKKLAPWKNEVNCGRQLLYDPDNGGSEPNNGQLLGQSSPSLGHSVISPYIVNGEPAELSEFPWQCSIQVNSKHRCGASILNEYYLLTAAHCLAGRAYDSIEKFRVIVGDLILDSNEDESHPQILQVESLILNFDYKEFKTHVNDIAIVKLKSRIKYSSSIQPICLAFPEQETTHKTAIVTGYGRLNATYPTISSPRLQKLEMKILPNEECKEMHLRELSRVLKKNSSIDNNNSNWLANNNLMGNDNRHVCAITNTNSTVCFGDSGGPLTVKSDEDGRFTQVGVVSYGLGECGTGTPVAFTRVSEYLQFIALATLTDS